MSQNGNASAYPAAPYLDTSGDRPVHHGAQPGLTKRELIAAMVLAQLAPRLRDHADSEVAREAVRAADSLLAELAK